jgi:hypothetical protein
MDKAAIVASAAAQGNESIHVSLFALRTSTLCLQGLHRLAGASDQRVEAGTCAVALPANDGCWPAGRGVA